MHWLIFLLQVPCLTLGCASHSRGRRAAAGSGGGPACPYLCCAPVQGGRPIAIQAVVNMRKRLMGPPQGCVVAVVVTDIEGYSGG